MFIIFDEECFTEGETLDKAIESWRDVYSEYPNLSKLTIVKGVKHKLTLSLDPIVEKQIEKQVGSKTTKVK